MKNFRRVSKQIGKILQAHMPKIWDGKQSILHMRDSGGHNWKQMEWIGFYFQFLCEKALSSLMQIPGPRFDNTTFDAFLDIPWDFKSHAMNTTNHKIIVNDSDATSKAIKQYGKIGLVLAVGKVDYNDEMKSFRSWHSNLKGGLSDYEIECRKRGAWSRLRKVSFELKQISFICLTKGTLSRCCSFQTDFRNADGSPRRAKVILDLEEINGDLVYFVNF